MKIDIEWLEEYVFLCKLCGEDRELLDNLFEVSSYNAGDVVVKQGEEGGKLFLIRSGSACITCDSDGQRIRVADIGDASMFGEMSFLTGDAIRATVTVSEDSVIYNLSRGAYSEMMIKNQDLVYSLFAHMLVHAGSVIRRMNDERITLQRQVDKNQV